MISVLILTLNEEENLPHCLASVEWCDDIVVFDSFSTDRTVEIAYAAGARVVQRAFDNYAAQRNAALSEVPYRHRWILMIDADECVTEALRQEIFRRVGTADEATGLFRVRRKDIFLGRWLRRSSGYPTWFGRLIRAGRVRVVREINEEYHTDGKVGFLEEHLLHYPFNKGLSWWYERHNRYSSMEALYLIAEADRRPSFGTLWSDDPADRRRALKKIAYSLPLRPALVFLYLYVIRLGLLDGRAGLVYCVLRMSYEIMIDLKRLEIDRRNRGLAV